MPVLRETVHRSRVGGHEVCNSSVLQKAKASETIADPKSARDRSKQGGNICGRKLIAKRRPEKLEADTIETKQSGRSSEPKVTVSRLRQGFNRLRRALFEGPGLMDNPLAFRNWRLRPRPFGDENRNKNGKNQPKQRAVG